MNPRVLAAVSAVITLGLGVAGLLYPDRVMGMLGFGIVNTSATAAVLGEVRATYGGLFVVIGTFTLLCALDPSSNRARLTFIGCMWFGAAGGRLLGTSIDGSPGLFGWLSVGFEALMGAALLAAAFLPKAGSSVAPPLPAYVPPPSPTPSTTSPPSAPTDPPAPAA